MSFIMRPIRFASTGHIIAGSGLFNQAAGTNLTRTPSSAGNSKTFRIDTIVKFGNIAAHNTLVSAGGSNYFKIDVLASGKVNVEQYSGSVDFKLETTQLLRDFGAYYQISFVYDSTPSTPGATNVYIEINGTRVTSLTTATYPSQNTDCFWNSAVEHVIGDLKSYSPYELGSYLARVISIDGSTSEIASEVTDDGFLQFNDASGLDFGDNGFLLTGGSAISAGTDSSGNSNDFSKTGTITATNDSPTNGGDDNEYGNLAVISPLFPQQGTTTLSNGNRTIVNTSTTATSEPLTIPIDLSVDNGIYYLEVELGVIGDDTLYAGMAPADWVGWQTADFQLGVKAGTVGVLCATGSFNYRIYQNTSAGTLSSLAGALGDRFRLAVDTATGNVWGGFYDASTTTSYWLANDGTNRSTDEPALGTNANYQFTANDLHLFGLSPRQLSGNNGDMTIHVHEDDWIGVTPSGAKSIATQNLPTPDVINYEDEYYIEAGISHSNGSTTAVTLPKTVSGGAMVRIKRTDGVGGWYVFDTVRGANKFVYWDAFNSAEDTSTFTDQNLTGTTFTIPSGMATGTYMLECFLVSEYFQIDLYSGNSATRTLTYDTALDTAPGFMTFFHRTGVNGSLNVAYHVGIGATHNLATDTNAAQSTITTVFNDTEPTTTGYTLGNNEHNNTSNTYVSYHWANSGPYAFGSYTDNNSADGPMINLGGSPQTMWHRRPSYSSNSQYYAKLLESTEANFWGDYLFTNLTNAEAASALQLDVLSNGWKQRAAYGSTHEYIYGAFGIQPLTDGAINQGRAK